jgi:hypothetical protein
MADDDQGEWLNVTRAAHRLGWPRERLRSLVRRGKLPTMRSNTGELLVFVTPGLNGQAMVGYSQPLWPAETSPAHPASQPPGQPQEVAELRARLEKAEADRERLTRELIAARERAAAAESELRTLQTAHEGHVRALRDALFDLCRRLDRAEERLAASWWRKLFGSGLG